MIKFAQLDGSNLDRAPQRATTSATRPRVTPSRRRRSSRSTTTGITLKGLIDDYGVLVPELVEAILPEEAPAP